MEIKNIFFLEYFIDPHHRVFWLYILSTLLIGIIYFILNPKTKRVNISLKLWLHPSATLDYRYFIISYFIKVWIVIPLLFGANEVALFIQVLLNDYFGYHTCNELSYSEVMILFTITLFVVSDFTRYWLHRFMHTIPILWKFHQIHHSAKVLTPITFYRVHPIENILFGLRFSLTIGFTTGIFIYFFGGLVGFIDVMGINIIIFIFNILGSNLRHSHIKLKYFSWIEKIFISPFQHQIHHSTKFYNYNFGGTLAIWDLLFTTLKLSCKVESIKFGLDKIQHKNLLDLLLLRIK